MKLPSLPTSTTSVSVERVIPAPPEAVFDLLAHPQRHSELDGSGTVQRSRRTGRRVGLGDSFGMDMKWGVPYSTRNEVVEFEENRRIAWRTLAPSPLDKVFTGRTWRYEIEPVVGASRVRETWDLSTEAWMSRWFLGVRLADHTRRNMERTLERIEGIVVAARP